MRRWAAVAVLALATAAATVACEQGLETLTPVGETRIDCQGVPPQNCQQALNEARASTSAPLLELVVRCTAPPCTFQEGQIEVRARYADGSSAQWGSGWSGAAVPAVPVPVPAPTEAAEPVGPLPVEPICLGVPEALCSDMASSAISELPPGSAPVASITVRCTAVCTPTKAQGDTIVVFADGTNLTSGWAFESVGG
jgi:hypothetical protein